MYKHIYHDIFEAIRHFEKTSDILKMKYSLGCLKRYLSFQIIQMKNGKYALLPNNFFACCYRGENNNYAKSKPSMYRQILSRNEMLICELKIIDFEIAAEDFPQAQYYKYQGLDIQYDSLAQHYGLKTNILDLSSDIAVAAFFATHKYNEKNNTYSIIDNGIGKLFRCILLGFNRGERIIGMQPFERPGIQCAFGIKMNAEDDFNHMAESVLFYQNAEENKKIHDIFYHNGQNTLFPNEEIAYAATRIIKSKKISHEALIRYCKYKNIPVSNLITSDLGKYRVSDEPIYHISRDKYFFERYHPKNNFKITSRLYFTPQNNKQ